jgi:hypothetical protein
LGELVARAATAGFTTKELIERLAEMQGEQERR